MLYKVKSSLNKTLLEFVSGSIDSFLQLLTSAAKKSAFARILNCPTYPIPVKTNDLLFVLPIFIKEMNQANNNLASFFAQLYSSACNLEFRKKNGQFFTPFNLAQWAITLTNHCDEDVICDAGCGTGIFAEALLALNTPCMLYIGIENDPILILCTAIILDIKNAPLKYKVWYNNFLTLKASDFERNGLLIPNIIFSNPPYIRYHNLKGNDILLDIFRNQFGSRFSSFSGAANYFICQSAIILQSNIHNNKSNNSIMLFFLPKEADGSAHSRQLRDDLQFQHGWNYQTIEIPSDMKNSKDHSNALSLLFLFRHTDKIPKKVAINNSDTFFVGDILKISRGISTGCNRYFILTDTMANKSMIPLKYLRAIIPTRLSLKNDIFSMQDWQKLREEGYPCWLLSLPNDDIANFEESIIMYLKEGIREGVHMTPTAKCYKNWYSIPIPINPPDVFITYMFRGKPHFIINEAKVLNLTNLLSGCFKFKINHETTKSIIEILNNNTSTWITDLKAGREYRGGLRKIEPKEIQKLPIMDRKLPKLIGINVKNANLYNDLFI